MQKDMPRICDELIATVVCHAMIYNVVPFVEIQNSMAGMQRWRQE
jgi:hypothetical protein